ncbi:hypothetical protein [Burkholderia ubonensis]|uniref:hypothetical protein n=1 Tax=Burkholderia ubonensis TaxID=101571 RepID=UPI0012FCFA19|nr:hypothetical protein [Burkholderia ubonensis]
MAWLLVRNNGIVMSGRYLREPAWTPSEQFNQSLLEKKGRSGAVPCTLGSVIAFNENYMEIVDWAYQKVGLVEVISIFMMFGPMAYLFSFYVDTFSGRNPDPLFYNSVQLFFAFLSSSGSVGSYSRHSPGARTIPFAWIERTRWSTCSATTGRVA